MSGDTFDISGMPLEDALRIAKDRLNENFAIEFSRKHGVPADKINAGIFDREISQFIEERDRKLDELRAHLLRNRNKLN